MGPGRVPECVGACLFPVMERGGALLPASVVERLRGGQPWKAGLPGRAEVPAGGGQPGDGLS